MGDVILDMKKLPSREDFEEVADVHKIPVPYIEKDFYSVKVLKALSELEHHPLIFAGGTSLSKAYNLIKRFSEDLDFKVCAPEATRGQRRKFREEVLDKFHTIEGCRPDMSTLTKHNESRFFQIGVEYNKHFEVPAALRSHLKLELFFEKRELMQEKREVNSFVSDYAMPVEADCAINTISPIETAADKYCALLWRLKDKHPGADRDPAKDDPAILRHLHDLVALAPTIFKQKLFFMKRVNQVFATDHRRAKNLSCSVPENADRVLKILNNDKRYFEDYQTFVQPMLYDIDTKKISFKQGIQSFAKVSSLVREITLDRGHHF